MQNDSRMPLEHRFRLKVWLLAVLISVASISNAADSSFCLADSINPYYSLVYSAEKALIENHKDQALDQYMKAFSVLDRPFLKDLHNAFILSLQLSDQPTSELLIGRLVQYDIDTNFYFKSEKAQLLQANEELMRFFHSELNSRSAIPRNCIDQLKLKALDQAIRASCREVNRNYYRLCGDEIKVLDSITYSILTRTFHSEGVPGDFDECKSVPGNAPYYYLIQLHNNQWSRVNLDSFLFRGVTQCRFHPQLYAELVDHYRNSFNNQKGLYGSGYAVKLGERLFVFDVPKEYSDKINPERRRISLDSLEDHLSKVVYQYRHPEYLLIYPILIPTLDVGKDREMQLADKWKDREVFRER